VTAEAESRPEPLPPRQIGSTGRATRWIVATVDEIAPGGRKIVELGDRSVGIFNVRGEFFALRNRCPHQGGPLCIGRLAGLLTSSGPGEYNYSRAGEMVRCPWHGWEFDVRSGQSWFDPKTRVRRYDVQVAPGAELAPPAAPGTLPGEAASGGTEPGMEGLEKGPYVAETFPVSIEQHYVVVEVR
jgi:3-phenylpropionate/trans-cinnamate dioxygenase ferredoxin subunit